MNGRYPLVERVREFSPQPQSVGRSFGAPYYAIPQGYYAGSGRTRAGELSMCTGNKPDGLRPALGSCPTARSRGVTLTRKPHSVSSWCTMVREQWYSAQSRIIGSSIA
jgi:hypothetical protein